MIKGALLMLVLLGVLGMLARGGEVWRRFRRGLGRSERERLNALCPRCGRMGTQGKPCTCKG